MLASSSLAFVLTVMLPTRLSVPPVIDSSLDCHLAAVALAVFAIRPIAIFYTASKLPSIVASPYCSLSPGSSLAPGRRTLSTRVSSFRLFLRLAPRHPLVVGLKSIVSPQY